MSYQFFVIFINFSSNWKNFVLVFISSNIALLICTHILTSISMTTISMTNISMTIAHVLGKVDYSCLQRMAKGWQNLVLRLGLGLGLIVGLVLVLRLR